MDVVEQNIRLSVLATKNDHKWSVLVVMRFVSVFAEVCQSDIGLELHQRLRRSRLIDDCRVSISTSWAEISVLLEFDPLPDSSFVFLCHLTLSVNLNQNLSVKSGMVVFQITSTYLWKKLRSGIICKLINQVRWLLLERRLGLDCRQCRYWEDHNIHQRLQTISRFWRCWCSSSPHCFDHRCQGDRFVYED